MTTLKAITPGCEKTVGDKVLQADKGKKSPGRGSRDDGSSKVPNRGLKIRRV